MAERVKASDLVTHAWRATPDTFGRKLSQGALSAPPHVRLLGFLLFLCANGVIKRMTIALPPGHGKSTVTSQWFPAWDLDQRPADKIILTSYESTLAEEHGKATRELILGNPGLLRVRLRDDSQAANRWRTEGGGGLWTAGAGGAITGRRARIFIVDDPFKGYQDSHSPTQRDQVWNWYRSVARTRLLPGASVVIVQTRWHEQDLIGRVSELPGWVHVRLPAIAEKDETIEDVVGADFVAKCKTAGIPLPVWHRKAGEALWPWLVPPGQSAAYPDGVPWFDAGELEETRIEVGEWVWGTLYQQNPHPLDGTLFTRAKWNFVDAAPSDLVLVRRWDMAATDGGGDFTAGALVGIQKNTGRTFILDIRRGRYGPLAVEKFIADTAREDLERYGKIPTRIEKEGGSAGKSLGAHYVANVLPGHNVEFLPSTGSKEVRSQPLAAQQQAGNVFLVRTETMDGPKAAPWWNEFIEECASFPGGHNDDMIDAVSLAYIDLLELRRIKRAGKVSSAAGATLAGSGAARSKRPQR